MNDILEEFDKYISSNKEVLSVLPINTKKNRTAYVKKVDEMLEKAVQIKEVIWNEIASRYERYIVVEENPEVAKLQKEVDEIKNVELFNELNTPYEKLGLDRITHRLSCFFEGDLKLVNTNIKEFLDILKNYGITVTIDDFCYSDATTEYMTVYLKEYNDGSLDNSNVLKKTFESIYWKCPDIVTHIELNLRYIYHINAKQIEKELLSRNEAILAKENLDKNGLVRKYFDLNKELIKVQRKDPKLILDKFLNGEWKIKDFNDKEMSVLYDRLSIKNYYECSDEEQQEIDLNFGKLLNTLQEYKVYLKYKFIIDDLREKFKNKDGYKAAYDNKVKELRKKEQALLKENRKNKQLIKQSRNPLFRFFKKKWDRKIYEFPVVSNTQIKEINKLYDELDQAVVNVRIGEVVDDNCSIKYMFKIATSFYTYAYNLINEEYAEEDVVVLDELQELIDFIDQPYKVMLNNIKLIEEPDITSIISNRYKILNLAVEKETLEEDAESLLADVTKVVDFYNIRKSGLDLSNIAFVERAKQMISKK